jgi:hypothetical protein
VLDEATHNMAWNLARESEKQIQHFGLAYNSLGAGASVNHLHIHGFVDKPLAIEHASWQHNGGELRYPLKAFRFNHVAKSWQCIHALHRQNQPYNLLYRSGSCYVIPRKPPSAVELPGWLPSVGWTEACGSFNLSDENNFNNLTSDKISHALLRFNTEDDSLHV